MAIENKAFQLLLVLTLTFSCVNAQWFDITKFGARGDGRSDSTQALANAWKAACASPTPSKVIVPKGIFLVRNGNFEGPCKAPITMQLQGTIRAPADEKQQIKGVDWLSFYRMDRFTLNGGGVIDGAGRDAWRRKLAKQIGFMLPTSLGLNFLTNAVVEDITVMDSKMFQVNVFAALNMTLQRLKISAPYDSPNTDGIHIGRSNGVRILNSEIMTGDDCVSMGDGSQHVFVNKVACGPGHGIAIGSLGKYPDELPVSDILVKDCSLTNTENGLRIKTWEDSASKGYVVSDVHFEDIVLTNVTYPINIDQEYCPSGNCGKVQTPSNIKIDKLSFKNIRGTSATPKIAILKCSKAHGCSNVDIADINIRFTGPVNVPLRGHKSTCKNVHPRITGRMIPRICTKRPRH